MLPRRFVLCTMLLLPSSAVHVGKNVAVASGQVLHNVSCILCSAEVDGRATGSVRVFAGHAFVRGQVAGNVLVFGGNVTLSGQSRIGGRVIIFGGHLHQEPGATSPAQTVLPPIIFLPLILMICVAIGGLIALTRRMVHEQVAYPRLPRL
jgi:hypothetical protein